MRVKLVPRRTFSGASTGFLERSIADNLEVRPIAVAKVTRSQPAVLATSGLQIRGSLTHESQTPVQGR